MILIQSTMSGSPCFQLVMKDAKKNCHVRHTILGACNIQSIYLGEGSKCSEVIETEVQMLQFGTLVQIINLCELVPAKVECFHSRKKLQRLVHENQTIACTRDKGQAVPLGRILYLRDSASKYMPQSVLKLHIQLSSVIKYLTKRNSKNQ